MRILVFNNSLSLGGTEKAACRWALGLRRRGHEVLALALGDGPRRVELEAAGIPLRLVAPEPGELAATLRELAPEVIHAHVPGFPHPGDALGAALKLLPKRIPVVQTNVFGRLDNPAENEWTDFRLFISWTSCVQAAQRSFTPLDERFFHHASVAVYPLDPLDPPSTTRLAEFRQKHGVQPDEVLFGRFSRPEPNKWSSLALDAFRYALRRAPNIKLLLREPPQQIAAQLRAAPDASRFVILPATSNAEELHLTMSALDVVLHTSSIGESFGYGIAEPMNFGRPVVTHSVPWGDQAQIELARHGECGYVASTPAAMAAAMIRLAGDPALRRQMGAEAQRHIRALADPEISVNRLEASLQAAVEKRINPRAPADLGEAREAAHYLARHQFGHSLLEQLALRPFYYRVRFHQFRHRPH